MRSILLVAALGGAMIAPSPLTSSAGGPRLLNLHEVVGPDDYPQISLQQEQQGTVTILLKVNRTGLVSSCKVTKSSGHAPLDEQTCALYRARARFEPARDRRGRAIDWDYQQRVTWKLEGEAEPPSPRHAWMVRATVQVDKQGTILDCKMQAVGTTPPADDCEMLVALSKATAAGGGAKGIAAFWISETYFYPVETEKVVTPEHKDTPKVAQQVSRIVIEADGQVSDCKGVRYSGVASPEFDACQMLRFLRFVPAPAGTASLVGTVVMTMYLGRHSVT